MVNLATKKTTKAVAFVVILLAIFINVGNAVIFKKKVKLKGRNKFHFLTKFAIGEDKTGYTRMRARFIRPWTQGLDTPDTIPIDFNIYTDDQWDKVINLEDNDCWGKASLQTIDQWLNVPTNGEWTESVQHHLNADRQTKLWFFSVCDCEELAHTILPTLPKVEIELFMINDESHFSQEDMYILPFYVVMFIVFLIFMGKSILEFYNDFKSEESVENPLIPLMISINADIMHLGFMCIHLFFIYSDGSGFFVFSVFARLFKIISQATMMWLLITISFGWTVTYKNMVETDIYILTAIFVIMIHLLIGALTYVDDEEHHKYHDFGGVQGVILMILRLIIFGVFVYGIKDTSNSADRKQKSFLWSLTITATTYILSFPTLWIISMFMDRYVINRFITFGTYSAQAFAAYYILHQLTKKGSSYYKASHKSKTLLPGAKFD
ncbi:unnamed protein product [Moneuplotes crassus]|uniref:GPR180/TMEM145 transmembrane domain-containing protein n=1 Tax=Euplotes crassus TaxID=5936 RepID=A0AAD1XBP0_EUPCR|nr:unnamed protein product [Moneuplotes crassus]